MIHYWVLCGNLEKKVHLSVTHLALPDTETVVTVKECKENETNKRVMPCQGASTPGRTEEPQLCGPE